MTDCKCGSSLRKGESECDECLLKKYDLWHDLPWWHSVNAYARKYLTNQPIAKVVKALRIAEKSIPKEEE